MRAWSSFSIKISVSAVLFAGIFFYLPYPARLAAAYLFIPLGLWCAIDKPWAASMCSGAGIVLLVTSGGQCWSTAPGLLAMLAGSAVVPLYFARRSKAEENRFIERHSLMAYKAETVRKRLTELEQDVRRQESTIEQISRLYLLGRELVEHTDFNDVAEHLQHVLSERPGIRSVAMFRWDKNAWSPVFSSDAAAIGQWHALVIGTRALPAEKRFRMLPTPGWLGDAAVIYWPIRIERNLLGAILIAADPSRAEQYRDEGAAFIPQIALGIKQTYLFAEVNERSRNDGLTGLYLRRYFHERLQAEVQRAKRYGTSFSLVMIDIDFFKKVNDTYGHIMGDKVLCSTARILVDSVRPGDLVGRYGGEEFIILMPSATPDESLEAASRISRAAALKEYHEGRARFAVTVSIGLCHFPVDGRTADELIDAADQALYWVKRHGRNGVREYNRNI